MSEQLQDLIEQIKKEGIHEAQEKGRAVELQSKQKAEELIRKAKIQAEEIVADAKAEQQKLMDSTQMALKQASRDLILNLRKEIDAMLHKIITHDVQRSLTPESLAVMIKDVVAGYLKNTDGHADVAVMVNAQDLKKLKDGFLAELKEKIKHSITLRSADNMGGGFTISFDHGKSFFDFSDTSLAEFLSLTVNSEIARILKEAV